MANWFIYKIEKSLEKTTNHCKLLTNLYFSYTIGMHSFMEETKVPGDNHQPLQVTDKL